MKVWHHLTKGETLAELKTGPEQGLSPEEAKSRLEQYGPNELEAHEKDSLLKRFLAQMKDLLKEGDNVLVKASHGMHFPEIVDALQGV